MLQDIGNTCVLSNARVSRAMLGGMARTQPTIRSAADLWSAWVRDGTLKPQNYDSDIEDLVKAALDRAGFRGIRVTIAMNRAGWTARDLIHTLAPAVASFAGMMRDLLRLMTRISATSGNDASLRVVYEFEDGEVIDESLDAFRERVSRVERVAVRASGLTFDPVHAFASPLQSLGFRRVDDPGWPREPWQFGDQLDGPVQTGNDRVDELLQRNMELIERASSLLATIGETFDHIFSWVDTADADDPLLPMAQYAHDWLLSQLPLVRTFARAYLDGEPSARAVVLDDWNAWLDGFRAPDLILTLDRDVDDLLDVLNFPSWGKRHELYSAWITTQIDRALKGRLSFELDGGALRFPFKPHLVARLDAPFGDLELWSELRVRGGTDLLGASRKNGVQPDYLFIQHATRDAVLAVEAKQYLRSAKSRHAIVLRDYTKVLKDATVLLVAHGPIGANVVESIPEQFRSRAQSHSDVRVGRPHLSAEFRRSISELLPEAPVPQLPVRIELKWEGNVHDLDLHVDDGAVSAYFDNPVTAFAQHLGDEFDGGPEVLMVNNAGRILDVRVHSYSGEPFRAANPVVRLIAADGTQSEIVPTDEILASDRLWWHVSRQAEDGRLSLSSESRVRPAESAKV
jgi:hypothetical protein